MEWLQQIVDLFLHLDHHLGELIQQMGGWVYGILFLVVFCETGLVVTPWLPGDSLLFAAGVLASDSDHSLNIHLLLPLLLAAALLGDNTNYWIGRTLGRRAAGRPHPWIFREAYITRTRNFFARYGGKTIILARFVPIVRTFTPFVAGVGMMPYGRFLAYSVAGGCLWVSICGYCGYFFGQVPFVRDHFSIMALGVVAVSLLPLAVTAIQARMGRAPA